jgi:hypothetical protein
MAVRLIEIIPCRKQAKGARRNKLFNTETKAPALCAQDAGAMLSRWGRNRSFNTTKFDD